MSPLASWSAVGLLVVAVLLIGFAFRELDALRREREEETGG